MRIGFDLDNTVIDYSKAASIWIQENKIIAENSVESLKKFYQSRGNYDSEWLEVQEWLYSDGLRYAVLAKGVTLLLKKVMDEGGIIFFVSHKSQFSAKNNIDLRAPATFWLKEKLDPLLGTSGYQVFFEITRRLKVQRIRQLNLELFVDDLVSVFQDSEYPRTTKGFWLTKSKEPSPSYITKISSFEEMLQYV
jgi:hypothetical protein